VGSSLFSGWRTVDSAPRRGRSSSRGGRRGEVPRRGVPRLRAERNSRPIWNQRLRSIDVLRHCKNRPTDPETRGGAPHAVGRRPPRPGRLRRERVTPESCQTDPPRRIRYLDTLGEGQHYRPFGSTVIDDHEKCLPPAEMDAVDHVQDVQAQFREGTPRRRG